MNKNKPVHEIRLSLIKASIWENPGTAENPNPRYNVTVVKMYKDGNDWKFTDGFGPADLLLLAKVVDRAHSWICDQRPAKEQARAA